DLALLFGRFVVYCDFSPVHDAPERLEVIGAAILVFEVVGMFPDIATEDRFAFGAGDRFAHERVVLIGGGDDFQLAIVYDQPGPTAAESAHTGGFELFLESVETVERGFNIVSQFS